LRIFGYLVYIHVPKEKRTMLEPSGRKGTFVVYNNTSKAYWIYILGKRYVDISWDVRFEEHVAFKRSLKITTIGEEQESPKVEESKIPLCTKEWLLYHDEELEESVD
jgi:hypothetical protein